MNLGRQSLQNSCPSMMDFLRMSAGSLELSRRGQSILTSPNPRKYARKMKVLIAARFIVSVLLFLLKTCTFLADCYIKDFYAKTLVDKILYSYYFCTCLSLIYTGELLFYSACNVSVRIFLRKYVLGNNRVEPLPFQSG